MRRNSGFWWLIAVAVGVGVACVPERLSGGSGAMAFTLLSVCTLAGAVLISYIMGNADRKPVKRVFLSGINGCVMVNVDTYLIDQGVD